MGGFQVSSRTGLCVKQPIIQFTSVTCARPTGLLDLLLWQLRFMLSCRFLQENSRKDRTTLGKNDPKAAALRVKPGLSFRPDIASASVAKWGLSRIAWPRPSLAARFCWELRFEALHGIPAKEKQKRKQ